MSKEKLNKVKKPFYKKWWVWVLAVIIIASIASGGGEESATTDTEPESTVDESAVDTIEEVNEAQEVVDDLNNQLEEATGEDVDEDGAVEKPKEEAPEPVKEEPAEPEMTVSQESAIQSAESYISMGGFSKKGLIEQLEYEGFSNEEASFAVENIDVDWKEQAEISAKTYMDMGGFSHSGLIEQLTYEGFTSDEATYGVDQVGL
ncbi:Ltp family lipoprotein [Peribacillus simplex]|uniref:Ltp family lipoprotein n=1 Tax=Peribacillus simplex TaxID=1478 RepID=UPI003D2DFF0F